MSQQSWVVIRDIAFLIIFMVVIFLIAIKWFNDDDSINSNKKGAPFLFIIWLIGAYLLFFVAFTTPITLYRSVSENVACAVTFIFYLLVGLPLFLWLVKTFYRLKCLVYPKLQTHQQFQPQQPAISLNYNYGINIPPNPIKQIPSSVSGYWVCYHGTKTKQNAFNAAKERFKPGSGNLLGYGVYITFSFKEAQSYSSSNGIIFQLYIYDKTQVRFYDELPGYDGEEKMQWCHDNYVELVYVRDKEWFIIPGFEGVPTNIPGLKKAVFLDYYGKKLTRSELMFG